MFQYIGAAVSLVVLIAAVWGGYRWGSHDVDAVKAELADVRQTAKLVKDSDDAFRKKLDQELAAQAKDHDAKMAELKDRDAKDIASLQAAKSLAEKNAAAFRAQAGAASGRIDALQKQLQGTLPPEERARLQKDLDAAKAARDLALGRAGGEDCLKMPVPAEVVQALNRTAQP